MTNLLKKAFAEAARLDGVEQDALARWLLNELASQRRWDETFAGSQDALGTLADKALAEHRHGRTQTLDPDKLRPRERPSDSVSALHIYRTTFK